MNATPSKSWLPLAAVTVTLVLWASAFVAIRHLGHDFSPGALSLGRLVVGAACLAVVALARGIPRPRRGDWLAIVLRIAGLVWIAVAVLRDVPAVSSGDDDAVEVGRGEADPDLDLLTDAGHPRT